ncbi:MAG: class I SAM-dependent methyltransferase [Bacteroidetes bacterium]|nr:class I SAM-dependent methyltransferase [Bacteroidota bacterium]
MNAAINIKWEEARIQSHYEEHYFNDFQKAIGEFGGQANKFMFEEYVLPEETVLDFGCGGGFLLRNLNCREKIGVELNPVARDYCNNQTGIRCYQSLEQISNGSIDVAISSHCLEHAVNPFEIVSSLHKKLKRGGKIVIVVPLDNEGTHWIPGEVNNHLYSFSPMNLGNILQAVGFKEINAEPVLHKWVPGYKEISGIFGFKVFHKLSWLYGFIDRRCVQIKGVGRK